MWVGKRAVNFGRPSLGLAAMLAGACSGQVIDKSSAAQQDAGVGGAGGHSADTGGQPNGNGGRVATGGSSTAGGGAGGWNAAGGRTAGGGQPQAAGGGQSTAGRGPADASTVVCDFTGADSSISGIPFFARLTMETMCRPDMHLLDCNQTAASLLAGYMCGPYDAPPPVIPGTFHPTTYRDIGCGYEKIWTQGGYGGPTYVFSLSTGELVGAGASSDTNFGPCNAFSYVSGKGVDCPDARHYICVASGDLAPDAGAFRTCTPSQAQTLRNLPGRPECDCSVPSGVDPCFAPASCGCWCQQIETLKATCPGVR